MSFLLLVFMGEILLARLETPYLLAHPSGVNHA
jgi:hypothetical protein